MFIGAPAAIATGGLAIVSLGGYASMRSKAPRDVLGFVGLFAGPATIAAFLSIVSIYRERLLSLRDEPVEPVPE